MKIAVLVNEVAGLIARSSTAMISAGLHAEGHELHVFTVADLGMDESGEIIARTRHARSTAGAHTLLADVSSVASEVRPICSFDAVLSRTNPARDERTGLQTTALQLLHLAAERGVTVLNDPAGLSRAASKAYMGFLPGFTRPRTICSSDRDTLRRFLTELGRTAVLKPATGTRGIGVFRIAPDERNLNQILDLLLERGMVMAQEYVPEADAGDTRVVVVGGKPVRIGEHGAAIRRVPSVDDFRSNIHAGGHAAPGHVTPAMERVIEAVGPVLVRDGLFLVGLDFIGDVLCEVNVYSPGGLYDLERFTALPFARHIAQMLVAEVERRRGKSFGVILPETA